MKKIFTFLFLIIFLPIFSQSQIKKWNSQLKRYEYFDSKENLVGYEEYNAILKQWEYFDSQRKNKYDNYNKTNDDFFAELNRSQDQALNYLESLKRQGQYESNSLKSYVVQLQNVARELVDRSIMANEDKNYIAAAEYSLEAYYKMTTIQGFVNNKNDVQFYRINYLYSAGENYELAKNHQQAISIFEEFWKLFYKTVDKKTNKAYHLSFASSLYNNNQIEKALLIIEQGLRFFSNDSELITLKNHIVSDSLIQKTYSSSNSQKKSPLIFKKGSIKDVFTNSPIYEEPNSSSKTKGIAKNNKVLIIEQSDNETFYKVKSGEIVGYIWVEMIKQ